MHTTAQESNAGHERHHGGRRIDVTAHVAGHAVQTFEIGGDATLLHTMERAAMLAGFALLPPRERSFDLLHAMHGEVVGPVIEHLDDTLTEYLRDPGHAAHFTVELARAIHVNNRWDVAPKEEMTPREILALPRIHLDPAKYTLYLPESTKELPPDTPIKLERGTDLEAQADGKYGGGR
jgi:hypothetical protein